MVSNFQFHDKQSNRKNKKEIHNVKHSHVMQQLMVVKELLIYVVLY